MTPTPKPSEASLRTAGLIITEWRPALNVDDMWKLRALIASALDHRDEPTKLIEGFAVRLEPQEWSDDVEKAAKEWAEGVELCCGTSDIILAAERAFKAGASRALDRQARLVEALRAECEAAYKVSEYDYFSPPLDEPFNDCVNAHDDLRAARLALEKEMEE